MQEIHLNNDAGLDVWFVRFNGQGQVALSDGSAWEAWGASGHTIADYRVAAPEIGTGSGHYVGSFDASANINHSDTRIYFIKAFKKVATVYTRIAQGTIIWNGTTEVEIKGAEQVVAAFLASVGFTAGGTMTVANLLKSLAAFIEGTWNLKTGTTDIWQVTDADNKAVNVLEIQVKEDTNPYKLATRL